MDQDPEEFGPETHLSSRLHPLKKLFTPVYTLCNFCNCIVWGACGPIILRIMIVLQMYFVVILYSLKYGVLYEECMIPFVCDCVCVFSACVIVFVYFD